MSYIGRFAPSPTGAMHMGTLAAAAASWLHARQAGGQWLVRIEDIDPPREVAGSAADILKSLESLALHWDGPVQYQSQRRDQYLESAASLLHSGKAFYCNCSRQQIRSRTGTTRYPGTCRNRHISSTDAAIRLQSGDEPITFADGVQGTVTHDIGAHDGDFIIVRRDGLPAYHLAVVIDDAAQGMTDVVRGADLLLSTPLHIQLQRTLGLETPRYWHIPLLTNACGDKLSKGSRAPRVDTDNPSSTAARVLRVLGMQIPAALNRAPPAELWQWATQVFAIEELGKDPIIAAD